MEDDEEIQSAGSRSPESSDSQPNDRITVTLASAAPPSPSDKNMLSLALPANPGPAEATNSNAKGVSNGKSNGGGREDCWSEGATAVLIDAWGERYMELSRGNLKQKHWKDVADIVNSRGECGGPKTDIQCKNRIDTVKKKLKQEKAKIASGGGPSKWVFFPKLDELIGPTAKVSSSSPPNGGGGGGVGVPVGIPVTTRSSNNQFRHAHPRPHQQQTVPRMKRSQPRRWRFKKRNAGDTDSESESDEVSPEEDSEDSLPPPLPVPPLKRAKVRAQRGTATPAEGGKGRKSADSVRELTQAILRIGEAYERAENAKLLQLVEMEKQRMKFVKDLELQRMQFIVNTQMEFSQMANGERASGATGNDPCNNNIINNSNKSNNSDSSS